MTTPTYGDVGAVRIWDTLEVWTAPLGTPLPTGATALTSPLNAAFEPAGLMSTDGLTDSQAVTTTDFKASGGVFVRRTVSDSTQSFSFKALEDNLVVRKLLNPAGTVTSTATLATIKQKAPASDPRAWVLVQRDGSDITRRIVIERGDCSRSGDATSSSSSMAEVNLTLTCSTASDGSTYTEFSDSPALLTAAG